jgi:acetyl esterase/lipase
MKTLSLALLCCVPLIMSAADSTTAATPNAASTPAATTTPALQNLQTFRLWAGDAPLAQGQDPEIDIPTLQAYLPAAGKATGAAIIIYPGGGYTHLSMVNEGSKIAQWLADNGITAFVLKYRLGMKYHHPAEMLDGQRAIRFVRTYAPAWNIDIHRIGVIGFSAGGHMVSTVATHFDAGKPDDADVIERASSRPDLHILLYPVITFTDEANVHKGSRDYLLGPNPPDDLKLLLSNEKQVTKDTPPAFVVHSVTDRTVPVANSDEYVAALEKANVPVVYLRGPYGGHGFGLTDAWNAQCIAWLRTQKF